MLANEPRRVERGKVERFYPVTWMPPAADVARCCLIRLPENGLFGGRLAADDAAALGHRPLEGDAANGGFGLLLGALLAVRAAAPVGIREARLHALLKRGIIRGIVGVLVAELGRTP